MNDHNITHDIKFSAKTKNFGFTLVEIMIVVVVISILAALAIPAIKKARFRANIATYLSERRYIIYAIETHRNEKGNINWNAHTQMDYNLFEDLPPKMRSSRPPGPFGGFWFVRTGGVIPFWPTRTDDGSTAHIGLFLDTKIATSSEVIKELEAMGKLDNHTFQDGRPEYIFYTL